MISLEMMTDTEIRVKGVAALSSSLGSVEAERFIALISREPFDYTRWHQNLFENLSVDAISTAATSRRNKKAGQQLEAGEPCIRSPTALTPNMEREPEAIAGTGTQWR
jgi:hypothetical protein